MLPACLDSSKAWTTCAESTPTLFLFATILIALAARKRVAEHGFIRINQK